MISLVNEPHLYDVTIKRSVPFRQPIGPVIIDTMASGVQTFGTVGSIGTFGSACGTAGTFGCIGTAGTSGACGTNHPPPK
jgi:hypothetical protein